MLQELIAAWVAENDRLLTQLHDLQQENLNPQRQQDELRLAAEQQQLLQLQQQSLQCREEVNEAQRQLLELQQLIKWVEVQVGPDVKSEEENSSGQMLLFTEGLG